MHLLRVQPPRPAVAAPHHTRIRPPRDLVKLEDRLRLLLQPPLESLLAAQSLRFPLQPFSFQLDGIAFLYPRHRAVLADEMGLGKTMQTITAVRLSGASRAVATRAARLSQAAGDQLAARVRPVGAGNTDHDHRRRPKPSPMVMADKHRRPSIVNYETVIRDRDQVCDPDAYYDLVVLDESQRIKNAASTTNEIVRSIPRSRSWALTGTPIENSVEDLRGHLRICVARARRAENETAHRRASRIRLRAAPHERHRAFRPAAEIVSRRGN